MKQLATLLGAMLCYSSAHAGPEDELDRAFLIFGESTIPVTRLWDCLATSESQSEIVARTAVSSSGGKSDVKVTIRNKDGALADLFFSLELGKASLYRIAMPNAKTRKKSVIHSLLKETCSF